MGISGEPAALLNLNSVKNENIPVIQRFSGGGTVIVDEDTLFITFILAKDQVPIHPFPEPILRWSAELYSEAWEIPFFQLRENDYCIGEKKCGGNAQYIKKDRWLHHTSFLWDYSPKNMEHLLLPAKRPKYRQNRSHEDFLIRMKEHSKSPETLFEHLQDALAKQFCVTPFDVNSIQKEPHRQSTRLLQF